jgi:hypothetical protein
MVNMKRPAASRAHARVRVRTQRPRRSRAQRLRTTAGRWPSGRVVMRPLFFARSTQQMSSIPTAQEWIGGLVMLGAIASWGLLAALLTG